MTSLEERSTDIAGRDLEGITTGNQQYHPIHVVKVTDVNSFAIPPNAKYWTIKGKGLRFWDEWNPKWGSEEQCDSQKDSVHKIPPGFNYMSFPRIEMHRGYVNYGNPDYTRESTQPILSPE